MFYIYFYFLKQNKEERLEAKQKIIDLISYIYIFTRFFLLLLQILKLKIEIFLKLER
jgi:hypothetical protein